MTMDKSATVHYDHSYSYSTSSDLMLAKCCFFIPLRIGCFILGYLNLAYNIFQTVGLIIITVYIGVSTHGFNHVDHFDQRENYYSNNNMTEEWIPENNEDQQYLTQIGILLMVVLVTNIAWVLINICCLIELHKKCTGPVKVYLVFAVVRLLLSLASFTFAVMSTNESLQIFSYAIDLGLGGFFIFLYYTYTKQLKCEQKTALIPSSTYLQNKNMIY